MSVLDKILHLIDSCILEYSRIQYEELLLPISKGKLRLYAIKCLVQLTDLSTENQYFIVIEDTEGSHCVDWVRLYDHVPNRMEYWKTLLFKEMLNIIEYSFPYIFPVKNYQIKPFKENDDATCIN